MKQFFKFVFASCLGVFLAIIGLFLFGVITLGSLAINEEDKTKDVKPNSVLEIKFEGIVPELTDNIEKSPFESSKTVGIHDLIAAIHHAATDKNISGIFLNTRFIMSGYSTVDILRQAILDFKKSGKFVYAYGDYYSQGGYYLASTADSVMLNPNGELDFRGIGAVIPFMKNLFDRLDVKWEIYYAGQFKSATEPLRLDKMSDQNRLQMHEYINGLYDHYLSEVAKSRQVSASELRNYANTFSIRTAHDALRLKMVDKIGYYDEFLQMLRTKLNLKEKDKVSSIDLSDYAESYKKKTPSVKDKIAVVYAEGDIDYNGNQQEMNGTIEGSRYAKIIRKLRQDDKVKAIVLRVNSGGGSSLASDLIWRELDLARKEGKVIISSFGDYAASGGYYIAMASDSIIAEPNTLTGSIGVFGAMIGLEKTMKNKLGINFDSVKTTKYAVGFSATFDHTPDEAKILQAGVDSTYEQFLFRVANNRKMSRDQVNAIAQGRVWLAPKAKEIGLVDKIGTLEDAIAAAANKAGLKAYKTVEYPKFKSSWERFIESLTGGKAKDDVAKSAMKAEMGEYFEYYSYLKKLQAMKGPQMRLPYIIQVK